MNKKWKWDNNICNNNISGNRHFSLKLKVIFIRLCTCILVYVSVCMLYWNVICDKLQALCVQTKSEATILEYITF